MLHPTNQPTNQPSKASQSYGVPTLLLKGADIERGFRALKSEIEPVFHRLPERIKAHASICFMALIVYCVMRMPLKQKNTLSPEAALQQLRRIQRHSVRIDGAEPIAGISTIHQDQANEPPRVLRRLQLLRRWSHEEINEVLT